MYEFIRESKNFPFPYSAYQALLSQKITGGMLSQVNQNHSFSYYKRIDLTQDTFPVTVIWRLPEDYGYHLEGLRAYYGQGENLSPVIYYQLYQTNRNRDLQDNPIPLRLITTPGSNQLNRYYMVRLNITYAPAAMIKVVVQGQDGSNPSFVDLMTEGLRITREYRTIY